MEDYQQRVVDELKELERRHARLLEFIVLEESKFKDLDALEQARLIRQRAIMADYIDVLRERINAFK